MNEVSDIKLSSRREIEEVSILVVYKRLYIN